MSVGWTSSSHAPLNIVHSVHYISGRNNANMSWIFFKIPPGISWKFVQLNLSTPCVRVMRLAVQTAFLAVVTFRSYLLTVSLECTTAWCHNCGLHSKRPEMHCFTCNFQPTFRTQSWLCIWFYLECFDGKRAPVLSDQCIQSQLSSHL